MISQLKTDDEIAVTVETVCYIIESEFSLISSLYEFRSVSLIVVKTMNISLYGII